MGFYFNLVLDILEKAHGKQKKSLWLQNPTWEDSEGTEIFSMKTAVSADNSRKNCWQSGICVPVFELGAGRPRKSDLVLKKLRDKRIITFQFIKTIV